MKYIFSIFLILIFVTEHFYPITKSNAVSQEKIIIKDNICLSACDFPLESSDNKIVNDIWEIFKNELSWNTYNNKAEVQNEINRINNHGAWYFNYLSEQARPYLHYVIQEIKSRKLPIELALLPFIESNYDPNAFSHGSAAGFWQIIPSTARQYGVPINSWYDGRRDIVLSTNAALDYLTRLHKLFDGDWLLAIAAYNAGEGTVSYLQKRNATWGKNTDFWSLSLPHETKQYVPKFLALIHIIKNSGSLGIDLPELMNEEQFRISYWPTQIDLTALADILNITLKDIYKLNPGFNYWQSPPDGPHQILTPIKNYSYMSELINELPINKNIQWIHYRIRSGDCLSTIAKTYSTSVSIIKKVNKLSTNRIIVNHELLIPKVVNDTDNNDHHEPHYTEYKIKSGDSLWDISKTFNVSIDMIAMWNDIGKQDYLQIGNTIKLYVCENQHDISRPETIQKVAYHVKNGDSLVRIANRFNVSVSELVNWNRKVEKQPGLIYPGQYLLIYVDITQQHFDA
ncbi:MAG: LysM peptidoglycan-binding domain-containing protein [Candidatus Neomarinimicrobiota bacterium]|nr:LysM peptidoglycan-binding domain-containing protein [Candidatus Neomarinimicrobiota bacterium]